MIICHDLKLVFLHVPKCAGTALRRVFESETIVGSTVALFDFHYSHVLRRYVDLGHLPLMDFRHFPQWRYLKRYHTVACIRHPYARLASACREYYRQYSRETQVQMKSEPPSQQQLLSYLGCLPAAMEAHDLRYVHGFPISWFTHYGERPMVDSLLRLEHLHDDVISLADRCDLTPNLRNALLKAVNRGQPLYPAPTLKNIRENQDLKAMSNLLHREDFPTFGFGMDQATVTDASLRNQLDSCLQPSASHQIAHTSLAPHLRWYWGRNSNINFPPLRPTRQRHS